jgi:nitroreductase
MIKDLIRKNRSYRRFDSNVAIDTATLRDLVELARLSPSAANLQPLKFILSSEPDKNAMIFEHLSWAGYLENWPGPAPGERPTAYIIILGDSRIRDPIDCDHGIASQSILLGAAEKGLGGCIMGSIAREKLHQKLALAAHLKILLVIALGKPAEKIALETTDDTRGSIRYWRDENDVHHVPKRPLSELILEL